MANVYGTYSSRSLKTIFKEINRNYWMFNGVAQSGSDGQIGVRGQRMLVKMSAYFIFVVQPLG